MFQKDRIKLPFQFDVQKLQQEVKALNHIEWIGHFVTSNYEGDWSVIPLTAQEGRTHPILMASAIPGDFKFIPTPYLAHCPYIASILEEFKCEKSSIRLMKLAAGSEIKRHQDYDLDDQEIRVHIPIFTNEKVKFLVNDLAVKMKEGECWYLRLSDPHQVKNQGESDRIHLVMDLKINDWLNRLLIQ
ncbi:aspartyl/asparaginyl beta-hydroxylase domain-containing protein [Algoriphagus lutimaris]|uniref:aspartyl/asparaginyl beta-hydroxylase domain-containing protein n=1 Tax=Algoriphagus lutimaris TaxID=613197 RepID=UPI00196B3FFC|nr:aspartyl/asparaginyl beta-hydroxylase domain-containing protein [Algoriphagus lutimaris]MBN3521945.1 aspartyl/asparaginyl beta-hydroxylase domain-containing protein [Algoriphagus lutimaris]